MDEISKKDLLAETGISYGQLYRWKRDGLIPEEWFIKRSSYTGQETFFPRERALERVAKILEMKDAQSLEDIRKEILGEDEGELGGLIREVVVVAELAETAATAVIFETKDGKHFVVLTKDGKAYADGGVNTLMVLPEKEVRERVKANAKEKE